MPPQPWALMPDFPAFLSTMTYRSKAPLRLGFAGGGTDVSPYTDLFGGAVLNAAIGLYAHAGIEPLSENAIVLHDATQQKELRYEWAYQLPIDGQLDLAKGVYNHLQKQYGLPLTGFKLTTTIDVPLGSGLGTSSTLMVAIIGAFTEMLKLPLGPYDIAHLAFDIERNQLGFAGGRQDQYAATFGGINFMEFGANDAVIVNPLRLPAPILYELENNLLLYYTGHSRNSSSIIEQQQQNVHAKQPLAIAAMHAVKKQAYDMKVALLKGRLDTVGELFDMGFAHKRQMAGGISTPQIETIYAAAKAAGATGGKISGAGGGGFMFFYCPGQSLHAVQQTLNSFTGQVMHFAFAQKGLVTWTI